MMRSGRKCEAKCSLVWGVSPFPIAGLGNREIGEIEDISAAITKSSFRRHFHVTGPQQDWLYSPFPKAGCFEVWRNP
jgi:hypothetical protein